jgi:hypothetical protein
MKRAYVAGPMTGLPGWNYDAFNRAAAALRSHGLHVENPAENQPPPCGTWEGYMRIALTQLLTCDVIVLLPGGERSRGANLEARVAGELGITRRYYHDLLRELVREKAQGVDA